ncbi:hypothetical protein BDN72DRAFT_778147 [Pluteus cervinus]|uniref:Uncharacterized protein n=1 Tax=Pluteus cervinus TaxID=181527 RepID=A0ACD3A721_9AGAR|nr:hypothetical protein BDN72DRAFT_778147 [Pluteus cervinus]
MFTRLHPAKSSAAVPLATQISAASNQAFDAPTATQANGNAVPAAKAPVAGPSNVIAQPGVGGGYRPKGRPAEAELEDDSGSDDEESKLQVSMSVAQEKLKALAQRGGIAPKMKREPSGPNGIVGVPPHMQHPQASVPTPVPAPAPPKVLTYPYNLPLPEPPSTPRTTRRLMLQNEMPESLRRNLLWERKVSLVNLPGIRRSVSNGGTSGARGNLLGGLKPLTAVPSMVQLSAKGANKASGEAGPAGERRVNGEINEEEREQEKRRIAMARNHSSSGDFHLKGW